MRKFEKVSYNNTGIIPTRNDKGSAGYDFYTPEQLIIEPGQLVKFKTNIKACMEQDEVLLLYVRSSVGIKRNLMLANGTGVIDSTYYNNLDNEGNIIGALFNYGSQVQVIQAGERVMQGMFTKYITVDDDTPINDQRIGGIGSSGN